jgi:hypothetical protein
VSDLTGSSVQGSGNTFTKFDNETLYQHGYAYFYLLGVQALLKLPRINGKLQFNPPNPYPPSTNPVLVGAQAD